MVWTIEEYDLRKTFIVEKRLLQLAGFYPRRDDKKKFLFYLGALINVSFSLTQFVSMTVQMVISRRDLSVLSETLQYFITHLTFMCKLTNFVVYKKNLLEIEDRLALPIYYGYTPKQLEMVKRRADSCGNVGHVFRILCVIAMIFYTLMPHLDPSKAHTLPLPGWFPYNSTKYFYPSLAFQFGGICNTAYTNSTIDILTWMLISVTSGEFEILKENLEKLDYAKKNAKLVEDEFKHCVKHHQEIIRLVYKIENMFSKGIFLQFFASVVVICFTGFLLMITPPLSMQFGFVINYFGCMMWQVGWYCWYGHDVLITSNKISESFHMSNWYESDVAVRRDVSIFLERNKKPITLTAGKFVPLTLGTFTSILRSSYSYFAVLRRVYDDS